MQLQAWYPYYFSPFGVETKLRSYSQVGARISSARYLLFFSIFCFKYTFHFLSIDVVSFSKLAFIPVQGKKGLNHCDFFRCFSFYNYLHLFKGFLLEHNLLMNFHNQKQPFAATAFTVLWFVTTNSAPKHSTNCSTLFEFFWFCSKLLVVTMTAIIKVLSLIAAREANLTKLADI